MQNYVLSWIGGREKNQTSFSLYDWSYHRFWKLGDLLQASTSIQNKLLSVFIIVQEEAKLHWED